MTNITNNDKMHRYAHSSMAQDMVKYRERHNDSMPDE